MNDQILFSYGGGRQTVAMCIMLAKEVLPRPDLIVIADTSRENQSTWDYLDKYTRPLLQSLGLEVHVAPHSLATVDVYAGNGDMVMPAYTADGKLSAFCSNEWKQRVVDRYIRQLPDGKRIDRGVKWLGLAHDERKRWRKVKGKIDGRWRTECPLVDLMLNTESCLAVIKAHGWPIPITSSCWMCPNKRNAEWRKIRENPSEWEKAIAMDEAIREEDIACGGSGLWLHHSRVPLREADIDYDESKKLERQCSLGLCFV